VNAYRRDYVELRWTWSWTAVAIGAGTFLVWMALERGTTADAGAAYSANLAALSLAEGTAQIAARICSKR
jgi:hypothetical protein